MRWVLSARVPTITRILLVESGPRAVANAVADALGPLGVEVRELPLTPARIHRLIHRGAASGPDGA